MEADEPVPILAVDDQPENLLALEAVLKSPGLDVVKARSGQETLKHLLAGEYAVILLDAFMPEMDGFDTAKAIRSREKTRHTPIIFLTATHPDSHQAKTGYDIGAVDYIFKPFSAEILKAKVSVFVELFKKTKEIRRQAEQLSNYKMQLEQRLAELGRLNAELQRMSETAANARDQALEASRFKSGFLADMSHEIRTPMNGILGMIEVLLKSGLNDRQREYANTAREAGRSLLIVINDILDFSKIEAGKLTLERVEFDPVRLVESIAELLIAQAKQKELSLLTFVDPEIPQLLLGDPGRLRQILTNFAGNAIKFSDKGEVLIRTIVESQDAHSVKVRFSVSDRGIGLSEDEIAQLFQPFVQTDHSAGRRFSGTGLGLSISKRLVDLMGGQIGVTSVKEHGSTFWISLPLEKASSASIKQLVSADLTGIRVLIVDDEPGSREITHTYVTSWGMRNGTAGSAEEAMSLLLAAAKNDPYRLALIDLRMPGTDGLNLGKLIREHELLKDMKLILVTAFDKPGTGEEAILLGFDAYLTKPLKQSLLLNAITTVMLEPHKNTSGQLAPNDLRSAAPAGSPNRQPQARSELILVAEDHPINQEVALLLLRDLSFEVHIAENGNRVLDAIKRAPYSLIFMDCQMPELDGFETTRKIRKLESLTGRHVPIIAMTAHAIEGSREQCIAAGMDDYVSKPIDPEQLRLMLAKWLPEGRSEFSEQDIPQETLETAAPIDFVRAKSQYGLHFDKLIEMFIADAPLQIEGIKQAFVAQDAILLARRAHVLKGVCGTVCALPMKRACAQVEEALEEQDWQAVSTRIEQLAGEFAKVKDALAASKLDN